MALRASFPSGSAGPSSEVCSVAPLESSRREGDGFSAPEPIPAFRMMMTPRAVRVVVVDDDGDTRETLATLLRSAGYDVVTADDGSTALPLMDGDTDVVLTDLQMPMDGRDFIRIARPLAPHAVFMVMTGHGEIDSAVEAVKLGAEQYLLKPLELSALLALLDPAARRAEQHRELTDLQAEKRRKHSRRQILGDHPLMQRLLKTVSQVAPSRVSVVVRGESGTGKELIAHAIHELSGRTGAFVALNCAALAESVLESELFGHERGSFTGATHRREGRFKQADGGTLFLDEVSDVPLGVQVKLLRFLQEHEFERVGSNQTERVDVRVVAATHHDLQQLVQDGRFREDLYFRLNVVELDTPPLRSRQSDIPVLAEHYIRIACMENDIEDVPLLSSEAMERLLSYRWPGNVRELRNAMERAVVLCGEGSIEPEHLPAMVRSPLPADSSALSLPGMTLAELEKVAILRTLEAVGGSKPRAADMLGISLRTLQYRVKEWRQAGVFSESEQGS